MPVDVCALGVVQQRGRFVVAPAVVALGVEERDYFARHVDKIRETKAASPRSRIEAGSTAVVELAALRDAADEAAFAAAAAVLQARLAATMAGTRAADCVFAAVRVTENGSSHVSLVKLDAVVEAARWERLLNGGVTLTVLKELLPQPGQLQKGLSWPDPRINSDVLVVDRNSDIAEYFERAFDVLVSVRSPQAEAHLATVLHRTVPAPELAPVLAAAAELEGPVDEVLTTLASDFEVLAAAAREETTDPRPSGVVRRGQVAGKPLRYRADGIEIIVPPEQLAKVGIVEGADGWVTTITTVSRPMLEGDSSSVVPPA
jgi:hypothetical protein